MKPPVETVRIGKQGRDQLLKIRRQTGIEHWNVMCRWAFCASIREAKAPPISVAKLDGGVELTWKVFAGDQSDIFAGSIYLRASSDGFSETPEGYAACFRAHLHRGLGYLASGSSTRSVADFANRWLALSR
jgi:DNA sulfur modification protein DndE